MNFKDLDDLIRSGAKEIVLDSDIVINKQEASQYSKGIKLDVDGLAIDGAGHSIDAGKRARIFHCTGKGITLKNITFKRGFSRNAGAIYNSGQMNIESSTFENDNAQSWGGAIYNSGKLSISDSKFNECLAKRGGALFNMGELSIMGCGLEENASSRGAAIYANHDSKISISKSAFRRNSVRGKFSYGGAIHSGGDLTVEESVFEHNVAGSDGGAIYNDESKMSIFDCELSDNVASDHGGAVYANGGESDIAKSTFRGNEARNEGGGVYNEKGMLNISYCEFAYNGAMLTYKSVGGALYNHEGEMNIRSSVISNNSARQGGGLYNLDGKLDISDSTLTGNDAWDGGALYGEGGELSICGSDLSGNDAYSWGGAIYKTDCRLTIYDSTLLKNTAGPSAGAIENYGILNIFNCTFRENIAKENSGGALRSSGDVTIFNSTFDGNVAQTGGAICIDFATPIKIFDSTFENNVAVEFAGAIYHHIFKVDLSGFFVDDGIVNWSGAYEYAPNLIRIVIRNSIFKNNRPDDLG